MADKTKDDVWKTITADASAFEGLSTEGGKELSDLVRHATSLSKSIETLEEEVKSLKAKRQTYLFDLIPAKMSEMGMDKVVVDGNSVSLASFVQATMPKDPIDKEKAIGHLRDIGAGDFIKNQVQVLFGINEDNKARSIQADLDEQGLDTTARTWVEPTTLKKLVKERVQQNQEIDLELFNAFVGQVAKIKGE
ncbi:MAG TPA: hypothetical protein DCL80_13895 [Balneola sp.]|jgi:hypothetical protein|nr:hypothetical protein [Balneola sp.]|tara:strand:- start:407 stop:985 length:579 start_codon:yes stop_codon:yes gene_type:complete